MIGCAACGSRGPLTLPKRPVTAVVKPEAKATEPTEQTAPSSTDDTEPTEQAAPSSTVDTENTPSP